LRAVYEISDTVSTPVIGCGGIMDYRDALEFLSAGAEAVEVGTATLIDPLALKRIVEGLAR